MATGPIDYGRGFEPFPLHLLEQAVPMLSRHELEALTERLIERLDTLDGDPDLEEDDPAGQCDEDEMNYGQGWAHQTAGARDYAGCPLSDGGL